MSNFVLVLLLIAAALVTAAGVIVSNFRMMSFGEPSEMQKLIGRMFVAVGILGMIIALAALATG